MAEPYSNPYHTIINEDFRVNHEGFIVRNVKIKRPRVAILRFLEKIEVSETQFYGGTPCWIWKGCKSKTTGYGQFKSDGRRGAKKSSPHQFSHEYFIGSIPEDYEVDHLCEIRNCASPLHLEAITLQENRRRRDAKRTHCKHGHEFSAENTAYLKSGKRLCRECQRQRAREFNSRNPGYSAKYRKPKTA